MNLIQSSENLNILWANLIIEELVRNSVDYFCISPGSRSTPLVVATVRHPKAFTQIIYDERGAAFHALGYARSSQKPAVLICTSGTAAANYYPAVIEASQENLPMFILSADRPPELRNTGANQTIDQINLFGKYTRYFFDFPCPNDKDSAAFVLSKINLAFELSTRPHPGPIHLNCMFREPLAPLAEARPTNYLFNISNWLTNDEPYKKSKDLTYTDFENDFEEILSIIESNDEGIILAGRCENYADQQAILQLAKKLRWPVFADITSGLRFSSSEELVHHFDQILLSEATKKLLHKLPILHFGGQFVSKRLLQTLEKHHGLHIHINETGKIIDPVKSVSHRILLPPHKLISKILARVTEKQKPKTTQNLADQNSKIRELLTNFDQTQININEISTARIVSKNINENAALFLASSMPVRDMDMFGVCGNERVLIGSNRGASGIDGTIASAIGFAAGSQKSTTLIIGDLAFLHDMNSFAMLAKSEHPLTIVLVNNQGGGIFSFLPIADNKDVFEDNFGTPHKLTFKNAAEMFDLDYFQPESVNQFEEIYSSCQESKKSTLIEIRTNREENFQLHKKLQNEIIKTI